MICKKEIVPTEFMTDEFGFACHIDCNSSLLRGTKTPRAKTPPEVHKD
jgi:hypothetical protein